MKYIKKYIGISLMVLLLSAPMLFKAFEEELAFYSNPVIYLENVYDENTRVQTRQGSFGFNNNERIMIRGKMNYVVEIREEAFNKMKELKKNRNILEVKVEDGYDVRKNLGSEKIVPSEIGNEYEESYNIELDFSDLTFKIPEEAFETIEVSGKKRRRINPEYDFYLVFSFRSIFSEKGFIYDNEIVGATHYKFRFNITEGAEILNLDFKNELPVENMFKEDISLAFMSSIKRKINKFKYWVRG